jgi:trans-4-hydroxy-L-proline dehydratase
MPFRPASSAYNVPMTTETQTFTDPIMFDLPADLRALRDECLGLHKFPRGDLPEDTIAIAEAWSLHTEDEPWAIWKARRFAARLNALPVPLSPGEILIGKPGLIQGELPVGTEARVAAARKTLETMPSDPGGDLGHFHPDYAIMFKRGVGGTLEEIRERRSQTDDPEKVVFYDSCEMAMQAFSNFILKLSADCEAMIKTDAERAETWTKLADICRTIAVDAPTTFHEAIQLMNLIMLAAWYAEDHGQANYGRMDQTLGAFYEADLASGEITHREAFELICCLYIQQNRMHWPGGAVGVIVGGLDGEGNDVTNDVTYLALMARQATHLVYPTVGVAWHENTPAELMDFSMKMLSHGIGDPAFFNDPVISEGLRRHGVSEADSHYFMNSTCVEIKVAGMSNIWVACPYFSCPEPLLEAMQGEADGSLEPAKDFDELLERVKVGLAKRPTEAAAWCNDVWDKRTRIGLQPFADCMIADCLERGRDIDHGGARYSWVEHSWVGLANLVDSLVAVCHLVYDTGRMTLAEFYAILENNYEGHETLKHEIEESLPKYGTDTEEVDALAKHIAHFLMDTTESNEIGGHRYVPGFFCWIMHNILGSETMATPDGRLAEWPMADGAGPAQGREKNGPTAAILSATCWDHEQALGGLVFNAKFTVDFMQKSENLMALRAMIETYMQRGGFEIQVNVVDNADLRDAQAHPDKYRDLVVRVAGYSDYFVNLAPNIQDEVIARSEFSGV